MSLKDMLSGEFLKKVGVIFYEEIILPKAKEYVASTENPYDDTALNFLNDFAEKMLGIKK